jgi:hypothetical protein
MNYILHLNKTFEKFCVDERLTPFHISLYYSLFQYWNMARFRNPISISRDELMRASKIGSVNTYIRCIKELDNWAYIQYIPSYNPQKGSQVYLYNFNNSNDNGNDISSNKGSGKASKKADDKASEMQVIPSINNTNLVNNINSLNGNEHSHKTNSNNFSDDNSKSNPKQQGTKKEKSSAKNEKGNSFLSSGRGIEGEGRESRFTRPLLEEVKNYFAENNWQAIEADKFYNHYESNGWLVGGKTPMKNWKASTKNWMLNEVKFSNGKANQSNNRAGNLQTKAGKDYSEPL